MPIIMTVYDAYQQALISHNIQTKSQFVQIKGSNWNSKGLECTNKR